MGHTYLTGSLIVLTVWLILFLHRKDVRKEMLIFGLFFSFLALKLHSFYASILALLVPIIAILPQRRDLIQDALVTGIIMAVIGFVGFQIVNLIQPGQELRLVHCTNSGKMGGR